jgi:DNA-binding LytR/AlgR family response regulator
VRSDPTAVAGSEPSPLAAVPPTPLARIAVRGSNSIVLVAATAIRRLETEDNYVRIWADRPYLHKATLSGLVARLDPAHFTRVHRRHAVNVAFVSELRPRPHGEFALLLADGTTLLSGRSYAREVRRAFGLD